MEKNLPEQNTDNKSTIGISDIPGFKTNGVSCDIRNKNNNRLDLAVIYSVVPCNGAAVFTTNDIKAAPVYFCMDV